MSKQIDKLTEAVQTTADNKQIHNWSGFDFSDFAEQMAALKSIIFDSPTNNETKVQNIKEELSNGRYQVQSRDIADRLLEYASSLQ